MASTDLVYCELTDVEARTGLNFGGEEQPSNTKAMEIIEKVAFEINGYLKAAGYSLPVTDATDRQFLSHYNDLGAAYQCWYAAVQGTDDHVNAQSWKEDYLRFLSDIRDGKVELPVGSPDDGAQDDMVSIPLDRVDGYSEEAENMTGYVTDEVIIRIV